MSERRAFGLVRSSFAELAPCALHERMMQLYGGYLLVGGMPEAVAAHASGASFERIRKVQSDIRTAYVADMTKYGGDVVPIEVKSGRRVKSTSAARFAEKYGCPRILRLSAKNFGADGEMRSIPLYAACLPGE